MQSAVCRLHRRVSMGRRCRISTPRADQHPHRPSFRLICSRCVSKPVMMTMHGDSDDDEDERTNGGDDVLSLQALLNSDPLSPDDPSVLAAPHHVTLNHLYALSIKDNVLVLGSTHRYKCVCMKRTLSRLMHAGAQEKVRHNNHVPTGRGIGVNVQQLRRTVGDESCVAWASTDLHNSATTAKHDLGV